MAIAKENQFSWNEDYALGLAEIDAQHKSLFDIMNRLWSAIVNRATPEQMLTIIGELEQYTQSHFTDEENFMRATGYPDFDAHRKAHVAFIRRLAEEKNAVLAGNTLSLDLLRFLKDWLVSHIKVVDRAYADIYETSKQPKSFLGRFFQRFF
jgi:hemerythrin